MRYHTVANNQKTMERNPFAPHVIKGFSQDGRIEALALRGRCFPGAGWELVSCNRTISGKEEEEYNQQTHTATMSRTHFGHSLSSESAFRLYQQFARAITYFAIRLPLSIPDTPSARFKQHSFLGIAVVAGPTSKSVYPEPTGKWSTCRPSNSGTAKLVPASSTARMMSSNRSCWIPRNSSKSGVKT